MAKQEESAVGRRVKTVKENYPIFLGTIFEYYEFMCYGFMEPYISRVLVKGNPTLAWLLQWAVFIARPLGGTMLGAMSDRMGRERALFITLASVVVLVFIQGILPTYCAADPMEKGGEEVYLTSYCSETAGTFGVVMMVIMRVIQGIFTGGEFGCSCSLLFERVDKRDLGFAGGLLGLGVMTGILLANAVAIIFTTSLSDEEMLAWGWRMPFLFVLIPGIPLLVVRERMFTLDKDSEPLADPATKPLQQPPEDEATKMSDVNVRVDGDSESNGVAYRCGGNAWLALNVLLGALASMCVGVDIYLGQGGYLITRMIKNGVMVGDAQLYNGIIALATWVVLLPIGIAVDNWLGLNKAFMLATTLAIPMGFFEYYWMEGSEGPLGAALFFAFLPNAIVQNCMMAIAELFPRRLRATLLGLTWNLGMLLGGLSPVIASAWVEAGGPAYAAGSIIAIFNALGLCALVAMRLLHRTGAARMVHRREDPF